MIKRYQCISIENLFSLQQTSSYGLNELSASFLARILYIYIYIRVDPRPCAFRSACSRHAIERFLFASGFTRRRFEYNTVLGSTAFTVAERVTSYENPAIEKYTRMHARTHTTPHEHI